MNEPLFQRTKQLASEIGRRGLRVAFGVLLVLGGAVAPLQGDLLWLDSESPPISGLLVEEDPTGVTFRVRLSTAETEIRRFASTEFFRVVRTINPEILSMIEQRSPDEAFRWAETWLAIGPDLEANVHGRQVLQQLANREDLSSDLRIAVERLQLQSEPPGLARERRWRHMVAGPANSTAANGRTNVPARSESWGWYVDRLPPGTRANWLEAIRRDRDEVSDSRNVAKVDRPVHRVPRGHLLAALARTLESLPEEAATRAWVAHVADLLTEDDVEALLTVLRLEQACLAGGIRADWNAN